MVWGISQNVPEDNDRVAPPDLTISIVNHNSLDTLIETLQSINRSLHELTAEIVVVDNLCENPAAPSLRCKFPQVIVIENQSRLGFGANHNQTIQIARGRYVLVLNPDVILPPEALSEMLHYMDENSEIDLCAPRLVNESGVSHSQTTRPIKPLREIILLACYISNVAPGTVKKLLQWSRREKSRYRAVPSAITEQSSLSPQSVPWISGACMFFRRDVLEELGGFDEQFFLYFEETDWCLRATRSGKSIQLLPWITAVHIGGTSTRPNYLEYLTIYVQSATKFYRKHVGRHVALPMKLIVRSVATFNLIRWTLSTKIKPDTREPLQQWIGFSRNIAFSRW